MAKVTDIQDKNGATREIQDKDLANQTSASAIASTDYVMLQDTNGGYHKIAKASFTEAVRGALGSVINSVAKGTDIAKVPVLDSNNDLGMGTLSNLASVLGENESIITVTATEIASKNKPGIYYVSDDPGTGVYIPVGCSFVLVRKIYSNRSIQIAFNTWSYDGNKVFYRRSDDNNSFANKAWIRNYDEGILTDSTIMSSLASALGVVNGGTKSAQTDPTALSNNRFYWCDSLTNIPSIANSAGFVFKCPAFILFASLNRDYLLFRFYNSEQSMWGDWKKVTPAGI